MDNTTNSKKIIIIDDDEITRKLIESHLVENNFEVLMAENGCEGLDKVQEHHPDLIILDVEMPEMNGYTFITKLRRMDGYSSIPVIVLTAHEETKDIFQTKGVKHYFVKPIDFSLLPDKINELLE